MSSFWKTLLLSVLAVNLIAGTALFIYRVSYKKRLSEWTIKQVLERGKGELPHGFLAEALGLAQDRPTSWHHFSTKEAERKLAAYPFFKKVSVRKYEPNAVLVDYELRTPIAKVADFAGQAVDEEGVMFPLEPYYSPKRLPAIRGAENYDLAFALIAELQAVENPPRVVLVDLSEVHNSLLGQRKIVVILEERGPRSVLLELAAEDPLEGIERWKQIRYKALEQKEFKSKGLVIDLRLPHLAYLQ